MNISFNPALYFIITKDSLLNYINIETGGEHISNISEDVLERYITLYLDKHKEGWDTTSKSNYIKYILKHINK